MTTLDLTQDEMQRLEEVRGRWSDDEAARRAEGYWVREMVQMFEAHQRMLEKTRLRQLRRIRRIRGGDVNV